MKSLVLLFSRNARFSKTLIEKNLVFLLYREVQKSGISAKIRYLRFCKNQVFLLVIQIIQKNKIILMKNT